MEPNRRIPTARRLVTFVDASDPVGDRVEVSAFHVVELIDGSRVLLLDDRGWGSTAPWTASSVEDIQETARMVVGPDEPPEGRSYEEEEELYWACLHQIAHRQGVAVDVHELSQLPHDVVLTDPLRARVDRDPGLYASD